MDMSGLFTLSPPSLEDLRFASMSSSIRLRMMNHNPALLGSGGLAYPVPLDEILSDATAAAAAAPVVGGRNFDPTLMR